MGSAHGAICHSSNALLPGMVHSAIAVGFPLSLVEVDCEYSEFLLVMLQIVDLNCPPHQGDLTSSLNFMTS